MAKCPKVKVEDREYTVSADPAEWASVERYKREQKKHWYGNFGSQVH